MNPQETQFNKAGFIKDARKAGKSDVEILDFLQSNGLMEVAQVPQSEQVGFGKQLLRGVANPFLRIGANLSQVGQRATNIGRIATGKNPVEIDPQQPSNFGDFLGEAVPIGQSGDFAKDLKDALGIGAELASFVPAGRGVKVGVDAAKGIRRFFPTVGAGTREGAVGGSLAGAGIGLQEDLPLEGVGVSSLIGGTVGGVLGVALTGTVSAGRGVFDKAASKQQKNIELNEILSNPESPVSQRLKERIGKQPLAKVVANDNSLKEAVAQGIEPTAAFIARHADPDTKNLMSQSLDIAERAFQNPTVTDRSTDIAGKAFVSRVNQLNQSLKQAGKEVSAEADKLSGQQLDFGQPTSVLFDDLQGAGVRITQEGKLDFKGSVFEGISGAERALSRVWSRLDEVTDAQSAHRLKKFIDENVDFGKSTDGITGTSERILKNLRNSLDQTLDSTYPEYNAANSKYAEIISVLDDVSKYAGKDVRAGDVVAEGRAGHVMRTILQNSPLRAGRLQMMSQLDETARKYGYGGNDDLVAITTFNDALEDIFGSQASAGIQSQIARGIERAGIAQVMDAPLSFKQGMVKLGQNVLESARGINHENKVKAIRELLGQ